MTLEKTGMSEEQVMSVRDRPLEEAYEIHDIGHDIIVARLEAHGYTVEEHGDDARHADEVFYGDGPDLAVYDDDVLVCYLELKCKEAPDWFGRCNLRHYNEYVNFHNETDVPVFIWFALVEEGSSVIHREAFVEVEDTDQIDGEIYETLGSDIVFHEEDTYEVDDGLLAIDGSDIVGVRNDQLVVEYIPNVHGNEVIELDDTEFRSWPHFIHRMEQ